jgi:hypothetical protein
MDANELRPKLFDAYIRITTRQPFDGLTALQFITYIYMVNVCCSCVIEIASINVWLCLLSLQIGYYYNSHRKVYQAHQKLGPFSE